MKASNMDSPFFAFVRKDNHKVLVSTSVAHHLSSRSNTVKKELKEDVIIKYNWIKRKGLLQNMVPIRAGFAYLLCQKSEVKYLYSNGIINCHKNLISSLAQIEDSENYLDISLLHSFHWPDIVPKVRKARTSKKNCIKTVAESPEVSSSQSPSKSVDSSELQRVSPSSHPVPPFESVNTSEQSVNSSEPTPSILRTLLEPPSYILPDSPPPLTIDFDAPDSPVQINYDLCHYVNSICSFIHPDTCDHHQCQSFSKDTFSAADTRVYENSHSQGHTCEPCQSYSQVDDSHEASSSNSQEILVQFKNTYSPSKLRYRQQQRRNRRKLKRYRQNELKRALEENASMPSKKPHMENKKELQVCYNDELNSDLPLPNPIYILKRYYSPSECRYRKMRKLRKRKARRQKAAKLRHSNGNINPIDDELVIR